MTQKEIITSIGVYKYDELGCGERAVVDEARKATFRAYAPYSKFCVGAAILLDNGEIITGSNQENVAYPSGTCAERTACFYAHAQFPDAQFKAIAIAARDTSGEEVYSGGGLWNNTNITPAIGTARPYEYFGAPFIKTASREPVPAAEGILLRPCSFTPSCGRYAGEKCYGYQLMREPGVEYHSLIHTLQVMRYFKERYKEFVLEEGFALKLSDPVLLDYVEGRISTEEMREHVKVEEQKWIRKAKKFLLYDDQPYRIK